MAKHYQEADQSQYKQLKGRLSAYGVFDPNDDLQASMGELSADKLNEKHPLIHFNRNHQDEFGQPAGKAKVLTVRWVKAEPAGRGVYPYVRLRDIPYGAVGTFATPRKRYNMFDLIQNLAN